MKLVRNARRWWRWYSTQIFVVIAAFPAVWMNLPTDAKAMIPDVWEPWIVSGLAVAGLVARLVNQEGE